MLFNDICKRGSTTITSTRLSQPSGNIGVQGQTREVHPGLTHFPNTFATILQAQEPESSGRESRDNIPSTLDTSTSKSPPNLITTAKSQRSKTEPNRPPSILKKSRVDSSSQLYKSTRILSPTLESMWQSTSSGSDDCGSPFSDATVTMRGDEALRHEQTSSAQPDKRPNMGRLRSKALPSETITVGKQDRNLQGLSSQKMARKKPTTHAKSGASRRKPTMTRRKSSQTSKSGASGLATSLSAGKEYNTRSEPTGLDLGLEMPLQRNTKSARSSGALIPRPLKHDAETTRDELFSSCEEEKPPGNRCHNLDNSLVDPDFRSKFASKVRPETGPSFGSPPPLEHIFTQAAEASRPHQGPSSIGFEVAVHGEGKGKFIAGFNNVSSVPSKPTQTLSPANEDERSPGILPRTKSELTFLIEKGRKGDESQK